MVEFYGVAAGALAGLHIATWGLYKDSPYEGASARKFLRSVTLGGVLGALVTATTPLSAATAPGAAVHVGVVYFLERAVFELYKVFVRVEEQSKYFIPMQFHVLGRVVRSRLARCVCGLVCLAVLIWVAIEIHRMDEPEGNPLRATTILLVGGVGGWLTAIGGAWKDAPIEGFEPLKFVRSPLVALSLAFPLSLLTEFYLAIAASAAGYAIAVIETRKTFFSAGKPPGKFSGKPIRYPHMLASRRWFIPIFASAWAAIVLLWVAALA